MIEATSAGTSTGRQTMMLKTFALAAALLAGTAAATPAQDPQPGGTHNFLAPYGSSFGTLDVQASPSTQDEFPAKAMHRSLYRWNSTANDPETKLATDMTASEDHMTSTCKPERTRCSMAARRSPPMT